MVLQKRTSSTTALMLIIAVAGMVIGSTAAAATVITTPVFAQEGTGMSITADADEGSDTIMVTGKTVSRVNDVTILVKTPSKKIVAVAQVSPDTQDGTFEKEFKINKNKWTENGLYTITAQQGKSTLYKLSVTVDIQNAMTLQTTETESTLERPSSGIVQQEPSIPPGLEIRADAIEGSSEITIVGSTDKMQLPVTLKVEAPNGNIVSIDQITPKSDDNGKFTKDIIIGGTLWKEDGFYTITAQQGEGSQYKSSVQVDILDGKVIPEFGTIAALILAVAIISIIAISARSRLSIMPKY